MDKLLLVATALLAPDVSGAALPATTLSFFDNIPLPHYSAVTVSASAVNGIATNTHIEISAGNTKPTSIPVVGGPDCWFCPSDQEEETSWALLDLFLPGVWEAGTTPSGFNSSLPEITVDLNGDPKYAATPTTTEPETPAKRAATPTKTVYVDSKKFKTLNEHAKQSKWTNGQGWAIEAAWPPSGAIPVSEHYQLIAGYVSVTSKSKEEKDKHGKVTKVLETITRDYKGYVYDIRAQQVGNVKKIKFIDRGDSKDTWDNDKKHLTFTNMGSIRQGLTHEIVAARGTTLADTMGPYSYTTNNCGTFANRLYSDIAK
ncbi:hypothetical protein BO71DRAFT_393684 [Aspergillus ellipticus CBS 707.79]|uniref:Uncharacterized protein n=1 Tax=Aspergillus ellipticus CBS 707.79 TaxID=1448320 RepID=A0A319DRC6_9EURO|nr:hypothetical protein BO71DRAFT_393684 [Aspergillus ellipticus CBS 707.79]